MGGALSASASRERRILVVAGEASGDAHGARLVRALRRRVEVRVRGVVGPELRREGADALAPQEDLAVIGFSGVIARLPRILAIRDAVLREARVSPPDVAVLIDSPGFNLRLGPKLKALGTRIFYYIAPQVWAWHPERARAMAAWVDRLAVVFPFEEALFRDAGVPTTWVGHPLVDELAPEVTEAAFRERLELPAGAHVLGLLPGSRRGELRAHAAAMLEVGARIAAAHPEVVPVVALAPGRLDADLGCSLPRGVRVVQGLSHSVQAYARACVVASGTATLETALFGTPHVIVYRTGWLNEQIARRLLTLPRIGLPNIVAGREVVPELLQREFRWERVVAALEPLLFDELAASGMRADLAVVRERLGGPGASERAAAALEAMLG